MAHQSDDRIDSASTCPRHLLRQSVRPEPLQEHTFTVRAWSIRIMLKRGTLAELAPRPPRLRGCVSIVFCVFMTQASSSCQRLPQSRVDFLRGDRSEGSDDATVVSLMKGIRVYY